MKKLFICIIMMFCLGVNNSSSQTIVREGKTFRQVNSGKGHKADTLVTSYTFEDSRGNKYPIIINKGTGSCYIWRKKVKTEGLSRTYMKPEISQQIAKEMNIEYKPRNKK